MTNGIDPSIHDIAAHARAAAAAQRIEPLEGYPYPPAYEGCRLTDANLVLEGGAMRGLFTSGVLDVLMDRKVFCSRVIGVSAGALVGYNYVAGAIGRSCFINVKYCTDRRYLSLRSFAVTGNVYGRAFAFDDIPNKLERFDYRSFDDSPMTLVSVASNLETGEADYHAHANAEDGIGYLIASSSMPLVSRIVELDGKKLLDGGTCDSVPILYAMLSNPGKHIVVRTQHESYRKGPNKLMALMRQRYADYPLFLDRVAARHYEYNRMCRATKRMHAEGAAFVISPPEPVAVANIEHDPNKLLALYEQGVEAATRAWPALERYLSS